VFPCLFDCGLSIRAALLATLLLALLLASYRLGIEEGRKRGPVVPTDFTAHTLYARDYDISDIVKSKSDAELLIASIRTTAEPNSWDVSGGPAEMAINASSTVLTVSHVNRGHASVVQYLTFVRDLATKGDDLSGLLNDAASIYDTRIDGTQAK
jgi:hypothetical protein